MKKDLFKCTLALLYAAIILLILPTSCLFGDIERQKAIGLQHRKNLAHTLTPTTTFGFGQNIVTKKNLLFYPYVNYFTGNDTHQLQITPGLLYGITDWLSLYIGLPIIATQKIDGIKSHGINSLFIQMEYAFLQQTADTFQNQATIVATIFPPTTHLSSSSDFCSTSTSIADSTSLFFGTTASHLSLDWYLYAAAGVSVYTAKEQTKYGNTWYYQAGIGHYIGGTDDYTFAAILELNGTYDQKDRACGLHLANTGGSIFYIGPVLSVCSNKWQIQGGIQAPAVQKLNGVQQKQYMRVATVISILF